MLTLSSFVLGFVGFGAAEVSGSLFTIGRRGTAWIIRIVAVLLVMIAIMCALSGASHR